ncbi:DUF397 domain-containing protein [Streptomyces sp. NBC_01390]|uniref:DUF397 domain-containing protein n=1 Tax=Streptomyces sp. NBC_01390 TaxID=2903850 RepID=UPI00325609CF
MIREHLAGAPAGLAWFKSSYSDGTEGDSCVEIAVALGTVHVRDSKNVETGPRLRFGPAAWAVFVPHSTEY